MLFRSLAHCTNHTLQHFGFPIHPEKSFHGFVGDGINKLIERSLPIDNRDTVTIAKLRQYFVPYYNVHNKDFTVPYPGIVWLLERLSAAGVKLAIASNKYQQGTDELVKHYFPNITFDIVLGQREGIPVKPDPTIIEEILAFTKIGRASCRERVLRLV